MIVDGMCQVTLVVAEGLHYVLADWFSMKTEHASRAIEITP